ncbi:hypothetical protein CVT26_010135 [Gymnopilus dilepis]|uniref:RING-type domain-containing protein n=1 Tax=Gymnopilus dilepis TaxID=231916 RepID=A0A409YS51_9AGAR|nr:hypothetical protein CVT26_010135 [Gymnopilus dilepis]
MSCQRVPLQDFEEKFSAFTELSSVALGGRIVAVSDEFFAEAFHLLLVEAAPSMKGQFGPNGALYSGWETRRHNPTFDWCIIQLGTTGILEGFDVDTSNFNGNEAPAVSIHALHEPNLKDPTNDDPRWVEVLPNAPLGPNSRHLFKIPATSPVNYVKIHMYPDGGIARFRAYGRVVPVHPAGPTSFDLAHVFAGGRVLRVSDQHFGVGSNLILPGRGKNMGDGWETKRSRTKGHNDWVIIQLGAPGELEEVEIDTKHFLGNFPESCEIHATFSKGDFDQGTIPSLADDWTLILPRTKLGPDRQHYFELDNVQGRMYTHVKVTIYPDGGLKRVRVIGRKVDSVGSVLSVPSATAASVDMNQSTVIPVVPLTAEEFAPFGEVIQAYPDVSSRPSGIKVTPANDGTADKYHKLALLSSSYREGSGATAGISVYRCRPLEGISNGLTTLKALERHPFTSQAFIPMGGGRNSQDTADSYLVVVALNGPDSQPDLKSLKAFLASTAQGISYKAGIWHQPMTVLGKSLDLACVETQIGDGTAAMDSRKRPLAEDAESTVAKKRILTGANGSPQVNGIAENDEDGFGEKLEAYRKEAIYRRMKHYSREHERSQARVQELERYKAHCEAGLAAMTACWSQLIDTIRLIVKSEHLPQVDLKSEELFDLTAHVQDDAPEEFAQKLGKTANATQALVTKFVQLGDDNKSDLLQSERYLECQKAQNECAVLRSQLTILQSQLEDSEAQKEGYHNALLAAESRFERLQSATVREVEARGHSGSDVKKEGNESEQRRSSPALSPEAAPSPAVQTNGVHDSSEIDVLQEQILARDIKIIELEKEAALLRDQKTMLELDQMAQSYDFVSETPPYKALVNHYSKLESSDAEKSEQISRLLDEVSHLQGLLNQFEELSTTESAQTIQDLKNMLAKRDAENARIREQREQQGAELNERRHKDSLKSAALQEYKSLVESNSERINILQSELSRCKAQLAANANSEELMLFFLGGNIDEARFFERLKQEKRQLEERLAALEETFSTYQSEHPDIARHMKSEAEALEQLSLVKAELEKYQRTYGPTTTLPPDTSQLAEQLAKKERELEHLRLLERQRQETESSLFVELEKLSALWEALDRQLKSKVFDLSTLEDRLQKSVNDKAKSDNKFYAAMRDKEAIENERKVMSKQLERQAKVVDRLTEIEKSLRNQLGALEKENIALKKCCESQKDSILRLEKANPELQAQVDMQKKRFQELSAMFTERETYLLGKRAELRSKEDEFVRARKDFEKQLAQAKDKAKREMSVNSHSDHTNMELANLRKLAQCTTCNENYRSTIITKCMHTFCKKCVDVRLATRQRKCPYCNLPFGQSDVHAFFFQ